MNFEITHNKENEVFHTFVDKKECYLKYRQKSPVVLEYYETYVPPLLRGKQIASQLAGAALRYAQTHNYQVIASCSFVDAYINEHPHFEQLRAGKLDKLL